MTTALIRWCLKNGFLVILFMLALVGGGYYAVQNMPVDAIPDIGEKQVIVFADWPGRSPQDVDNQVTYPLTTSLTGTPGVKTIHSMSGFGFSMVFVIFTDDVDYYWARSRVIERTLPEQKQTGATFEQFWYASPRRARWPANSSKKKAEKKRNQLPQRQRDRAYNYLETYLRQIPDGVAMMYAETYLNKELWNN